MRPFYFDQSHHIELGEVRKLTSPQLNARDFEARHLITLAESGSYNRSPTIFLNTDLSLPTTRERIEVSYSRLVQHHESVELFELPYSAVTGQGAVITNQRHVLKESILEFYNHERVPDGFVSNSEGSYNITSNQAKFVSGGCLLAKRPWYQNYGHWLVDSLAVIALASELIRINKWKIVIGKFRSSGMKKAVFDSIKTIFPDIDLEILEHPDEEVWYFDQLFYVTPSHVPPLFKSPKALKRIREFCRPKDASINSKRRILVSRSETPFRRLSNENEVFEQYQKFGFELVYPERLSFNDQVKLFSEAEVVAGVKGAALTNCLFSPLNVKVIVFSPADFPDPFFWDIVGQLNGKYAEIFGAVTTEKNQSHNDFVLPQKLCLEALHKLSIN